MSNTLFKFLESINNVGQAAIYTGSVVDAQRKAQAAAAERARARASGAKLPRGKRRKAKPACTPCAAMANVDAIKAKIRGG
jgi:hypothetical protein